MKLKKLCDGSQDEVLDKFGSQKCPVCREAGFPSIISESELLLNDSAVEASKKLSNTKLVDSFNGISLQFYSLDVREYKIRCQCCGLLDFGYLIFKELQPGRYVGYISTQ